MSENERPNDAARDGEPERVLVEPSASSSDASRPETAAETPSQNDTPGPSTAAETVQPRDGAAEPETVADTVPEPRTVDDPAPATDTETLSPSVRRLVRQYGIDVSGLRGTGPGGRLRVGDVMTLVGGRDDGAEEASAQPAAGERTASTRPARPTGAEPAAPERAASGRAALEQAAPERAASGRAAPERAAPEPGTAVEPASAPVTTTVFECDVGRILEDRRRRRERGHEVALSAYFVSALGIALNETTAFAAARGRRVPVLAVDSPRGAGALHELCDADRLSVEQITVALNAPAVPSAGPRLVIRHHGLEGSLLAEPAALSADELGVLGIGRIRRQVVVRVVNGEEAPRIASQCLLSLTFRAGRLGFHAANALLGRCVERIERWDLGE